jgi:Domain of unknown function (DUF3883)
MVRLSPGIAYGCFELLDITSRNSLTFPQIHASFAYLGSIPAEKITETAQALNWLRVDDKGIATITLSGQRLLAISGYEPMLRQALLDYIDIECPPWVQNATFGRSRVLSFASNEIVQLFAEAGLAHGISDEVVAFWDALAARARGQKSDRLTAIGRQGERLTITYEEARTGRKPKWVAVDSNEDGYDVLSVVASDDARHLSIEVKASTLGMAGSFHLTSHEWERSAEADNHAFHLWAIPANAISRLAVITPSQMQSHIPRNLGHGSWESVKIPFAAFKANFQAISVEEAITKT